MRAREQETTVPFSLRIYDLGLRLNRLIRQHEGVWLVSVLLLFAAVTLYRAYVAPLWFDEIFTLKISSLPSLSSMLQAMPADGQPPMQYILTRVALAFPGERELILRSPESAAFVLAGLLTFIIARRRTSAVGALFAATLLMGAWIVQFQSFCARPYSLLLAETAFTFACWQVAANRDKGRALPLIGVSAGMAAAILTHHFGVIHVGCFLLAGEAARALARSRFDLAMFASVLAGLSPLPFTMRLASASKAVMGDAVAHSAIFWAKPKIGDLGAYANLTATPLLLLAFAAVALFVSVRRPLRVQNAIPIWEWAAVLALCLLLPAVLVLTYFKTGYFVARYAISCSLGLALLCAWAPQSGADIQSKWSAARSLALTGYLFGFCVYGLLIVCIRPAWNMPADHHGVSPLLSNVDTTLPIVVANADDFAQGWLYSSGQMRRRLVYLTDVNYAVKQRGFLGELSLYADRAVLGFPLQDYRGFTQQNHEFLLLASGWADFVWLPKRFADEGWKLEVKARNGADVLYRVSRP